MELPLQGKIKEFVRNLNKPVYVVGGYVRNYLISGVESADIDLCAPIKAEEMKSLVQDFGFEIRATYGRTGTVLFSDGERTFEYTCFRKDSYFGFGNHTPDAVIYTDSIEEDSKRRDFKCNALYYDLLNDKLIDVVGGLKDIENRTLSTVRSAEETFHEDGLRLLRLARFAGQLGFTPDELTLKGALNNADAIKPISVERIFAELKMILVADKKYSFSSPQGHYVGLKILDDTRVLDRIIPELTLGRGMKQRADFHIHDVLEHSLRCVLYADPSVRLHALLHDIGKPYCMINFGKYHGHDSVGEPIARQVLNRLKADKKTTDEVCRLVALHMFDMNGQVREIKLRRKIIENADIFEKILLIKQADYSASSEREDTPPTITRWKNLYNQMLKDGTPFSLSQLKITSAELIEIGFSGKQIGDELSTLFGEAIANPKNNNNKTLSKMAVAHFENLRG